MRLNTDSQIYPDGLDATLTALADPTRRAILQRLSVGERRVTDLAEPFEMSLNAVSKHIRTLERAGLITRRRMGREHVIAINTAPVNEAAAWLTAQRDEWTSRLHALEALLMREDADR